ncbi:hypothetical protein D3C81_2223960 [compost metagenome]
MRFSSTTSWTPLAEIMAGTPTHTLCCPYSPSRIADTAMIRWSSFSTDRVIKAKALPMP